VAIGNKQVNAGPLVMNTVEEIEQAIQDFNQGKFQL
jgi:redox-sensitive bicupin YhaK (pirin superfamily)